MLLTRVCDCSEWETLDSDNAKAEAALLQQLQ
jgi:hypothetical protein